MSDKNTIKSIYIGVDLVIDKDLLKLLKKMEDKQEVKKILGLSTRSVALFLDSESTKNTPVDKGILRSSQRAFIKKGFQSTIRNSRNYGYYVHEGIGQKAQPWMKDTIEQNKENIIKIFNGKLEKQLLNK